MLAVRKLQSLFMWLLIAMNVASGDEPLDRRETMLDDDDARWVSLPTGRETRSVSPPFTSPPFTSPPFTSPPFTSPPFTSPPFESAARPDLSRLMRPRLSLASEWELKTDGIEIGNYDVKLTVPTYPLYGPPPPFISAQFSYTGLTAPAALELPASLYDASLGAAWMRPLNERWMLRFMASAAFASDWENTSSDAWQFRGGVLATYKWTENLQLIVGAIASGRDDLPILPGLGAIWTPTPSWRVNLIMPRPRIAYLIADTGVRHHWVFISGGLSGGTWAFERNRIDDKLTYREWRVGFGWESSPPQASQFMPSGGLKLEAELGYVFGREFEFERRTESIDIDGTLLLRMGANF